MTSIAEHYESWPPVTQVVAQIFGAAAPVELDRKRITDALREIDFKHNGRRVKPVDLSAALTRLEAAGAVFEEGYRRYATEHGWGIELARIAQRHNRLQPIIDFLYHPYSPLGGMREMRLRAAVLQGDAEQVEEFGHRGVDGNLHHWFFLALPLQADLIRSLPASRLPDALAAVLEFTATWLLPPQPAIALRDELAPDGHADAIAFLHILRGDFDAALAVFDALPPGARDGKPARVQAAGARALIALLRGDDEAALAHIRDCLAQERSGTRKRAVFPQSRTFKLALLALVRIDTPESSDLLDQLLDIAMRLRMDRPGEFELGVVAGALAAAEGRQRTSNVLDPSMPMLYEILEHCWTNSPHPFGAARRKALDELIGRAAQCGYRWVAAECEAVAARTTDAQNTQGKGKQRQQKAGGGQKAGGAATRHAQLGTVSLVDLTRPLEPWEAAVKDLEQAAHDAMRTRRKDAAKGEGARPRRLAWAIQEGRYGRLVAEPREQRQLKNGSWSKGAKVSANRLATEGATMDFLLAQDKAAAASAYQYDASWGGRGKSEFGSKSLYHLAGHPHVFRGSRPVEVARREPELTIEELGGDQSCLRIEPYRDYDIDYLAVMATPARCEVTHFTKQHHQLFEIIPEDGLTLPSSAKERMLAAVSALASTIRVQSESHAAVEGATQVEADHQPWVRLEPFDAGITAALVVEPIADAERRFAPGKGGATVFISRAGESLQAQRDLAAERAAAERLIAACPPLAAHPTEQQPLLLPDPEEALELIEALRNAEARCKWPQGEPLRIVASATSKSLALRIKSADEWMQASGDLKLDAGQVLNLKRVLALLDARPESRFLELKQGEFVALADTFRSQLHDLASISTAAAGDALRLNPLAALALDDIFDEAELDADRGWLELRRRLREAQSFEPELPSTLQAELRPYQIDGFRWLARLAHWGAGACLADDMGLGKTVQTLAVLLARAPHGPSLVVAPTSVVANWVDEAQRFAPTLNVKFYLGAPSARRTLLAEPAAFDLYITTYGLLQNDVDALAAVRWRSVVLDEAQAIKNPAAKRSRAARKLHADFRVVTTGTPIQNNLMDLHALFSFANPGLLGSLKRYRGDFALPIERDANDDARDRLRRLVAPFVLRRLKTDVLKDLPERTEITLHVAMSEAEAALYEALRQRAVEELEAARSQSGDISEGARRVQVLAHLTRLRLACCNPRLVRNAEGGAIAPADIPSAKMDTFAATLAELLEGRHKVLVFSQFVMHLKLVEEHVQQAGIAYQYLDGATPAKARAERIAAFQAGQGDVFLISLKAGGVGLNLTAADYVIHMDPWWNPAVEDQASDRAHRIGQTRPVTIYRLVTEGTIEEQILELHHRKRDLADQLLEGADQTGRLDADALLELLRQPLGG